MEPPIPQAWINDVVRILRSGTLHREIVFTRRALQDWEATTTGWPYELVDAIKEALSRAGICGNLVEGMEDPGETYEFWIYHQGRQLYAKVCLLEGKVKVKIISAHTPLKGTERL
jgi:hypothetical protein